MRGAAVSVAISRRGRVGHAWLPLDGIAHLGRVSGHDLDFDEDGEKFAAVGFSDVAATHVQDGVAADFARFHRRVVRAVQHGAGIWGGELLLYNDMVFFCILRSHFKYNPCPMNESINELINPSDTYSLG